MNKVYLDYSATTPVDKRVLEKMQPYFSDVFGNASSIHSFGKEAVKGVDWTKGQLCSLFGCKHKEIIFTSGATESNALALRGVVQKFKDHNPEKKYHLITSTIEHPSVLKNIEKLEKEGLEVTYIPVSKDGIISTQDVVEAVKENTILISIMYVNNEVGTIQPIREIGKQVEKINKQREKEKEITVAYGESKKLDIFEKLYFHTDAVQAPFYLKMTAAYLHVDLISISAHKLYGPKGVGALYVREETPLKGIIEGGEQEYGLRPGTYNVPAIVGFGAAVELLFHEDHDKEVDDILKLRTYLLERLQKGIPSLMINGSMESRISGNLNIALPGIEGETLLLSLDLKGIAISTGSACAAGAVEASPVLKAMGVSKEILQGSIRITLGKETTYEEIDYFIETLLGLVEKLSKKRR